MAQWLETDPAATLFPVQRSQVPSFRSPRSRRPRRRLCEYLTGYVFDFAVAVGASLTGDPSSYGNCLHYGNFLLVQLLAHRRDAIGPPSLHEPPARSA